MVTNRIVLRTVGNRVLNVQPILKMPIIIIIIKLQQIQKNNTNKIFLSLLIYYIHTSAHTLFYMI